MFGRDLRKMALTVWPCADFYLIHDGRIVEDGDHFVSSSFGLIRLIPRLRGGKGGFGSMLRALGSGIERTTNREACRDLSGRRMRDVNADKKLAEWLKNESDREREREERRKEKLERRRAEPKHDFDSHSYLTTVREQSDRAEDAVRTGLCAAAAVSSSSSYTGSDRGAAAAANDEEEVSSSSRKRPASPVDRKGKKKRKRGLDDFLGVSDSSADEDDSASSEASATAPNKNKSASDGAS